MNREIKFRYRYTDGKNWLFQVFTLEQIANGDPFDVLSDNLLYKDFRHVGQDQFTGLEDVRGNDIYEGDICRILYTDWPSNTDYSVSLDEYKKSISINGEVVFVEASFWLNISDKKYGGKTLSSIHHGAHGEIEVIGNIYENSDLLLL